MNVMIRESGDLLFNGASLFQARANAWEATMTVVLRPRTRTLLSAFLFVVCYSCFVISLSAQAAALTGHVVDPDGRSVADAEIFVSGPTAAPLRARADADGKSAGLGGRGLGHRRLADGHYRAFAHCSIVERP